MHQTPDTRRQTQDTRHKTQDKRHPPPFTLPGEGAAGSAAGDNCSRGENSKLLPRSWKLVYHNLSSYTWHWEPDSKCSSLICPPGHHPGPIPPVWGICGATAELLPSLWADNLIQMLEGGFNYPPCMFTENLGGGDFVRKDLYYPIVQWCKQWKFQIGDKVTKVVDFIFDWTRKIRKYFLLNISLI